MGIFSRGSKNGGLIALFDIGSASVGGSLIEISGDYGEESKPVLIWSHREYIPFQKKLSSKKLTYSIKEAFRSVSQKMVISAKGRPAKIFCTLSSLWNTAQTREVSLSSMKSILVTKKILNQLTNKEARIVQKEQEEKYGKNSVIVIEKNNMEVKLNGYVTNMPYNKKADKISLSLYTSVGQVNFIENIVQSVKDIFHTDNIEFHTLSFVSFSAIRDMFPQKEDFLICDVSAEVTDISIIQDNILSETVSIPFGRNFLLREVMEYLSMNEEEAISRIRLFFDDKLNKKFYIQMKTVLDKVEDKWKNKINELFSSLSKHAPFPSDIFLTAGDSVGEWFNKVLINQTFGGKEYNSEKFTLSVFPLNVLFLRQFTSFEGVVVRDPFLMLEAIFIDKLLNLKKV